MLSADHLVICKAKADSDSPDSDITVLTARDTFSGIGMTYPGKEKDAKETVLLTTISLVANRKTSSHELWSNLTTPRC